MEPLDVQITVNTLDDEGEDADFKYCAIVMGWNGKVWYNTGIVVRENTARGAFNEALTRAKEEGWWK